MAAGCVQLGRGVLRPGPPLTAWALAGLPGRAAGACRQLLGGARCSGLGLITGQTLAPLTYSMLQALWAPGWLITLAGFLIKPIDPPPPRPPGGHQCRRRGSAAAGDAGAPGHAPDCVQQDRRAGPGARAEGGGGEGGPAASQSIILLASASQFRRVEPLVLTKPPSPSPTRSWSESGTGSKGTPSRSSCCTRPPQR